MEKALEQLKTISEQDYAKVKALAAIVKPLRSVLHKTPDDYGMLGWRDGLSKAIYMNTMNIRSLWNWKIEGSSYNLAPLSLVQPQNSHNSSRQSSLL